MKVKNSSPQSTSNQSPNPKPPRVAIVHDWLVGGGAERVVYELHTLYPAAPIYTAYCNKRSFEYFGPKADIRTGYMQKFPFSKLRKFLPILRQRWFEKLDLREYDVVISSSGAEAKGVKNLRPSALHINYCHTPTHYYWVRTQEYLKDPGLGILNPIMRLGLQLTLKPNRRWDFRAAQRPKFMIANSTAVQARIKEFYNRDSVVIHPPVDTRRFAPGDGRWELADGKTQNADSKFGIENGKEKIKKRSGFVVAGRQTPYKRIDLAVAACTLANLPLTVIGDGPEHKRLKKIAGPTVTFKGFLSEQAVAAEFQKAAAFIMPNEDDFGITPVEALSAGTPVIAYKAGGALDYLQPNVNGEFFTQQTPEALAKVLQNFKPENYSSKIVAQTAEKFSVTAFHKNIREFVAKSKKEHL